MRRPLRHATALFLLAGALLGGCTTDAGVSPSGAAPIQGVGEALPSASAAATSSADSGWSTIDPSMELRSLRTEANGATARLTILRFDPAQYSIQVKYDVANAGSLREWFDALKPVAAINGGYYDENGKATALVIFDGIRSGESYQGFGGMVVINEQGGFELRSLRQQAFDPNENLQQAMQSSPMLIQPGGQLSDLEPDTDRSRRTVIARDAAGRILLIVSDSAVFTLPELAAALKNSDLELDAALNLDGGRSTGMYVRTDSASVKIDSFDKLPLVLVVQRQ
jgi:exopolysaccharide biosynthesis protein